MVNCRRTPSAVAMFALVAAVSLLSPRDVRAEVIFGLLPNPTTTAGGGATSTRSGFGTWHLYAIDTDFQSFGISSYSVTLSGATAINHRSPRGTAINSDGDELPWGFTDLRSGTNTNPIAASQPSLNTSPFLISGFGKTAGNANSVLPTRDPDVNGINAQSSGAWGNYPGLPIWAPYYYGPDKWLFLAEGTGNATITSSVATVFSNSRFDSVAAQTTNLEICDCSAPWINNKTIDNVNANSPGFVAHTFTATSNSPDPATWGGLTFISGPTPAIPPTFDPLTRKFNWNTLGSSIGSYRWYVIASVPHYGASLGYIDVNITAVPEPATLSLVSLTMVLGFGALRRCR